MYLKLKADLGIIQVLFLIFAVLAIQIIFCLAIGIFSTIISEVFGLNSWYALGMSAAVIIPINALCIVVYTVKFLIESIFIMPANDYEKTQLIKEDEKNK